MVVDDNVVLVALLFVMIVCEGGWFCVLVWCLVGGYYVISLWLFRVGFVTVLC